MKVTAGPINELTVRFRAVEVIDKSRFVAKQLHESLLARYSFQEAKVPKVEEADTQNIHFRDGVFESPAGPVEGIDLNLGNVGLTVRGETDSDTLARFVKDVVGFLREIDALDETAQLANPLEFHSTQFSARLQRPVSDLLAPHSRRLLQEFMAQFSLSGYSTTTVIPSISLSLMRNPDSAKAFQFPINNTRWNEAAVLMKPRTIRLEAASPDDIQDGLYNIFADFEYGAVVAFLEEVEKPS